MSRRPSSRRLHRLLGGLLLVPCLAWALTGFLFHWKPGWSEAYAPIAGTSLPLAPEGTRGDWLETRRLRSVLGEHLLVRSAGGWRQWDEASDAPRTEPADEEKRRLFEDALQSDAERYGSIATLDGWSVTTTTGVEVDLDWNSMRFRQRGADTRRIDWLYRLHYLQWTGTTWGDRLLPLLGLSALTALSLVGLRLLLRD